MANGTRGLTAAEVAKVVAGYHARPGTRAEFCRQRGITESALGYYLRRAKQGKIIPGHRPRPPRKRRLHHPPLAIVLRNRPVLVPRIARQIVLDRIRRLREPVRRRLIIPRHNRLHRCPINLRPRRDPPIPIPVVIERLAIPPQPPQPSSTGSAHHTKNPASAPSPHHATSAARCSRCSPGTRLSRSRNRTATT